MDVYDEVDRRENDAGETPPHPLLCNPSPASPSPPSLSRSLPLSVFPFLSHAICLGHCGSKSHSLYSVLHFTKPWYKT
jgi:hypothetical protein